MRYDLGESGHALLGLQTRFWILNPRLGLMALQQAMPRGIHDRSMYTIKQSNIMEDVTRSQLIRILILALCGVYYWSALTDGYVRLRDSRAFPVFMVRGLNG
jgi:hypothetical protein